jgi:hypothetical protein
MNLVNSFCAVVPHSTTIAHTHGYTLEYDKALFMLKRLAVECFWTNGAVAMFARIPVQVLLSGLC